MARYQVYRTVRFKTEIDADNLSAAEELAADIDYTDMVSYDETDIFVERIDDPEEQREEPGEPCPYAAEIHNDYTPCQCSEEQRHQCAQAI